MELEPLLLDLGHSLGIGDELRLADGACAIGFDDGIQVDLHHQPLDGTLRLASAVGAWMRSDRGVIFRQLLRENAKGGDLDGCHFALDVAAQRVVLGCTVGPGLPAPAQLSERVLVLRERCLHWREVLARRGWLAPA